MCALASRFADTKSRIWNGLKYFLEVEIAREAIDVWRNWRGGRVPSLDEKLEAVTYYQAEAVRSSCNRLPVRLVEAREDCLAEDLPKRLEHRLPRPQRERDDRLAAHTMS